MDHAQHLSAHRGPCLCVRPGLQFNWYLFVFRPISIHVTHLSNRVPGNPNQARPDQRNARLSSCKQTRLPATMFHLVAHCCRFIVNIARRHTRILFIPASTPIGPASPYLAHHMFYTRTHFECFRLTYIRACGGRAPTRTNCALSMQTNTRSDRRPDGTAKNICLLQRPKQHKQNAMPNVHGFGQFNRLFSFHTLSLMCARAIYAGGGWVFLCVCVYLCMLNISLNIGSFRLVWWTSRVIWVI